MISRNVHILLIAVFFVGAVFGLDAIHFWKKVGLEHPHGLIYQGLLFLGFYFLLSNTVFTPYIHIMEEREEQTVGKKLQVEATQQKVDQLLAQYQNSIQEARLKAIKERELSAIKVEEEAKNFVDSAKKNATASLQETKTNLEQQATQARKSFDTESQTVASEVVGKILTKAPSAKGSSQSQPRAQIS